MKRTLPMLLALCVGQACRAFATPKEMKTTFKNRTVLKPRPLRDYPNTQSPEKPRTESSFHRRVSKLVRRNKQKHSEKNVDIARNRHFFNSIVNPQATFQKLHKSVGTSIHASTRKRQIAEENKQKLVPKVQKLQKNFGKSVNAITGKREPYEFGDLTRWMNEQAKSKLSEKSVEWMQNPMLPFTQQPAAAAAAAATSHNHDDNRRIRHRLDDDDKNYDCKKKTGMNLGAIFFQIVQLVRSVLLVQIIKFVVEFKVESQVLRHLPVRLLIEILTVCLQRETRPKVVRVVGTELDKRLKRAVVGDEDYQFGDLTKRAVSGFTGKKSYQFGDIARSVLEKAKSRTDNISNKRSYKEEVDQELKVLEKHVANEYQFGDLTKHAVSGFTGKESYEFGDIARTVLEKFQTRPDKLLSERDIRKNSKKR